MLTLHHSHHDNSKFGALTRICAELSRLQGECITNNASRAWYRDKELNPDFFVRSEASYSLDDLCMVAAVGFEPTYSSLWDLRLTTRLNGIVLYGTRCWYRPSVTRLSSKRSTIELIAHGQTGRTCTCMFPRPRRIRTYFRIHNLLVPVAGLEPAKLSF